MNFKTILFTIIAFLDFSLLPVKVDGITRAAVYSPLTVQVWQVLTRRIARRRELALYSYEN